MDRRSFLRALGLGVAAAAAPKVTYSFLGGIVRPRNVLEVDDWRHVVRMANIDRSLLAVAPADLFDLLIKAHANAVKMGTPGCWISPAIDRWGNPIS